MKTLSAGELMRLGIATVIGIAVALPAILFVRMPLVDDVEAHRLAYDNYVTERGLLRLMRERSAKVEAEYRTELDTLLNRQQLLDGKGQVEIEEAFAAIVARYERLLGIYRDQMADQERQTIKAGAAVGLSEETALLSDPSLLTN